MVITTYAKEKNIYANASKSRRVGKVVKEKHIFQNRKHGLYKYEPETEQITELTKQKKKSGSLHCIDFGVSFFPDKMMERIGI